MEGSGEDIEEIQDSAEGEQYTTEAHLAALPGSKILQNKFLLFCGDKERTQSEGAHFGQMVSEGQNVKTCRTQTGFDIDKDIINR